jgi:hypothetical protein
MADRSGGQTVDAESTARRCSTHQPAENARPLGARLGGESLNCVDSDDDTIDPVSTHGRVKRAIAFDAEGLGIAPEVFTEGLTHGGPPR